MYKKILFYILVLTLCSTNAQLEGSLLMGLTNATTAEMNATTDPVEGSILYNSDENEVFVYDGSQWKSTTANGIHLGFLIINSTGNLNITGIPFQPSQVSFVAHANIESLNIDSDNGSGNNFNGIPNAFGTMNGFAREVNGAITQQVIYVGGNGTSINDISRYASSAECIGIRYSNQNGDNIGVTSASLSAFNPDGFTLTVGSNADNLVVLYQAYQ